MANQKKDIVQAVSAAIDSLGNVELSGIKLETADPKLLDVGSMDLDKHVAMQPSAIAYFGALKKEAARKLAALKRGYDRWEKKAKGAAKTIVYAKLGSKTTSTDVDAQFIADNEKELERWDGILDKAQFDCDTLEVWYEAWRQKSYSIREHVSLDEDEARAPDSFSGAAKGEEVSTDRIRRIRDIIRQRNEHDRNRMAN